MDFGAKMKSKGHLKSRNLGDISRPLARGGQMVVQGLQNGAKSSLRGSPEPTALNDAFFPTPEAEKGTKMTSKWSMFN